jgi:branched-chain amino acid transport system ATP-binding protein
MTNPRLLVLDEATEGLAPLLRKAVWRCLRLLRARGQAVLLIDKHVDVLSRLADRHYVMERGSIVWQGDAHAFLRDRTSLAAFLGVA